MDHQELEQFFESSEQSENTQIGLALLFESMGEKEKALKIWQKLKTQDAATKTVEILCTVEDDADLLRRLIKGYIKWVLEEAPRQAVDFFVGKYP